MLPDGVLSTTYQGSPIIGAKGLSTTLVLDYEDGAGDIGDASLGFSYQVWTGNLIGNDIILSSPSTTPVTIYSGALITEFSFTFDQNMRPVIAYIQDDVAKLRWYDTTILDYTITTIGLGAFSPKVLLDDKRTWETSLNDVILAYVSDSYLCVRLQRDRYAIEYELKQTCAQIKKFGMGKNYRVQFIIDPYINSDMAANCWGFDITDPYNVSLL